MFVRAAGPGGQNVNKTATKVQLHWNVDRSSAFSAQEKARIKSQLRHRMNKDGELVLQAGDARSQSQNRETALERLDRMVAHALIPPKPRIATKPTRASRQRRITNKKRRSAVKQLRRPAED